MLYGITYMGLLACCSSSKDMKQMSLVEAAEELKKLDGPAGRHEFVAEAIRQQRLDVLEMCLNDVSNTSAPYFYEEMKRMPPSDLRNQMLLMVLKCPLTNLRLEDTGIRSHDDWREGFAKSFIPMLHSTMPDLPVDYQIISALEKRMVLAARMERALGIESTNYNGATQVWPPKSGESLSVPNAGGDRANPNPQAHVGIATRSAYLPGRWPLWAGIAAAVAAAAGWLLLRRKGGGGKW